jgi:hypothetical protein
VHTHFFKLYLCRDQTGEEGIGIDLRKINCEGR